MKFVTIDKNDIQKRAKLYLKNKVYFDDRIRQHPKFKMKDKADIAINYFSTEKTLRQIGVQYHKSPERVRQITAEFLRMVNKIYIKNKKELDMSPYTLKSATKEIDRLYAVEEENRKLKHKIAIYERIINDDLKGLGQATHLLQEVTGKIMGVDIKKETVPMPTIREKLKEELFTPKLPLEEMEDEGTKGYFLEDIQKYLTKRYYPLFIEWNKGKPGGIIDGKLYVFKADFDEFLKYLQMRKYQQKLDY